jgi:hypothetical protein
VALRQKSQGCEEEISQAAFHAGNKSRSGLQANNSSTSLHICESRDAVIGLLLEEFIGDGDADMEAAAAAGIRGIRIAEAVQNKTGKNTGLRSIWFNGTKTDEATKQKVEYRKERYEQARRV